MKCFHPILQNTESCCRAVPDDKFEVQNNPTCANIGFSISALSVGDRIWRKGTTKFSYSHLAVNILRCWASNCALAGKPPVSKQGSIPRCRARKKGQCIGRKKEFILALGAWRHGSTFCVISKAQILCFARFSATRSGESKFFFSF